MVGAWLTLLKTVEDDGKQHLCLPLRQMAYLQYYIHEMCLADPVWIMHGEGEAAYLEGEEWVRLPDAFVAGEKVVSSTCRGGLADG